MIRRALELKKALIAYIKEINVSSDTFDREVADEDYLSFDEWNTLKTIKQQLELFFLFT
jgi:hypothetical protein